MNFYIAIYYFFLICCTCFSTSQATLSRHEKKGTIPYELLFILNENFNINLNWLISGKGSMILSENDNNLNLERIKRGINSLKKRGNIGVLNTIIENNVYFSELVENPKQMYFMALSKKGIDSLLETTIKYLKDEKRKYLVIECENKSIFEIMKDILNKSEICFSEKDTKADLYDKIEELLYYKEFVLIFKELSKSKTPNIVNYFRGLIKILDDAHFRKIQPLAHIIFLDYPEFLKRHIDHIFPYLDTNLIQQ